MAAIVPKHVPALFSGEGWKNLGFGKTERITVTV